jgi:hypothetical protein
MPPVARRDNPDPAGSMPTAAWRRVDKEGRGVIKSTWLSCRTFAVNAVCL